MKSALPVVPLTPRISSAPSPSKSPWYWMGSPKGSEVVTRLHSMVQPPESPVTWVTCTPVATKEPDTLNTFRCTKFFCPGSALPGMMPAQDVLDGPLMNWYVPIAIEFQPTTRLDRLKSPDCVAVIRYMPDANG